MKRQKSALDVVARGGYLTGRTAGKLSVVLGTAFLTGGNFMDGLLTVVTDGDDYPHFTDSWSAEQGEPAPQP